MRSYYLVLKTTPAMSIRESYKKLDATRVTGNFWVLPEGGFKVANRVVDGAVIFKRSRKLLKPRIVEGEDLFDLGSLTVIVYRMSQPSIKVRRKISRMLRKSPAFRIAHGVYAFPQVKYCVFQGVNMVTPSKFTRKLEEMGVTVDTYPNLVLLYPPGYGRLILDQSREHIREESRLIILRSKDLIRKMKQTKQLNNVCREISALKSRLTLLMNVVSFTRKVFKLNLEGEVARAYKAVSMCRSTYRKSLENESRLRKDFIVERARKKKVSESQIDF